MSELTDLANRPLEQQVIPQGLTLAMGQIAQNTQNLPQQYAQGLNVDENFLLPSSGVRYDQALGGPDQSTSIAHALGLRNERRANDYLKNMQQGIELNAPVIRQKGYQQQAANMGDLGQIQLNNYKIMKQQQMNQLRVHAFEEQQKQSLIAGILGIIGTVGGAVLGAATGGLIGGKK